MAQTETFSVSGVRAGKRDRWDIVVARTVAAIGHRWHAIERLGVVTPFQSREWLESWYRDAAQRGEEPLIVLADDDRGRAALILPLVRKTLHGKTVITFADGGVSDYNAPALGPAAPLWPFEMRQLWRQIRRSLPSADTITLEKMPAMMGTRPNPLMWLRGVGLSAMHHSVCAVDGPYDEARKRLMPAAFLESIDSRMKKLRQKADVRFAQVATRDEAVKVFDAIVKQKAERAQAMGWCNALDEAVWRQHYERLALASTQGGQARLLVLYVDNEPAAIIMGFVKGASFFDILTSFDATKWKRYSLGHQVLDQAMRWMSERGIKNYDLTIGAETYKDNFGPVVRPLYELVEARSVTGLASMAKARLKSELRRSPAALKLARTLLRRQAT